MSATVESPEGRIPISERIRLGKVHGVGFAMLRIIAAFLCPTFKMRYPSNWMFDARFNRQLDTIGNTGFRSINAGRNLMVAQLLRLAANVEGDTAECGVYHGATSYLIASSGKPHHLFDSFSGLSEPSKVDGDLWRGSDLHSDIEAAKSLLAGFSNVIFHQGWIPDRFNDVADKTFSFLHIDVDLYQPTSDSIKFFYPRLSHGAVVVCDDYGMYTCPGATKALDDFLRDKPEKMICLSDGGGFFIRGTQTS